MSRDADEGLRREVVEQDCYSRKATMGRELMTLKTDRTTRIPFGVALPVTTNHAAKGSVFVKLRNAGNFEKWPPERAGPA